MMFLFKLGRFVQVPAVGFSRAVFPQKTSLNLDPSHSASTASAAHQRHCWNPLREESAPLPPWGPGWLECDDRNLEGFFSSWCKLESEPKKHDEKKPCIQKTTYRISC